MELLINVHAQFLHKHTGEAIHGKSYSVRLYDKDLITDDFLGETHPDVNGKIHLVVNPDDYKKNDSPIESKPDFYLVIIKEGKEIFKTPVAKNINFDQEGNFNTTEGEWIDLGTFLIEE